jgi:hypothetical protein
VIREEKKNKLINFQWVIREENKRINQSTYSRRKKNKLINSEEKKKEE